MKRKVVIVGGGVSGLVCAYAFRKYKDIEITILEPATLGGEFLTGGLKYIHRTDSMVSMFTDLGLVFSNYAVRGGIMLRGDVHKYPDVFSGMPQGESERIQADHYRKTRRTEPGDYARKAMNDPASTKPRKALRTDFADMVKALEKSFIKNGGVIRRERLKEIGKNVIWVESGKIIKYDHMVLTIPLWVIHRAVNDLWYVPQGVAMKLNVVVIVPRKDTYSRWDYIYTPYTPANAIHRFSPDGFAYSCEINGELDQVDMVSDLNFIFKGGWWIKYIREGLKGHLLPLDNKVDWPSNVATLGRFAKWDSRATLDVALEDAKKLGRRWFAR